MRARSQIRNEYHPIYGTRSGDTWLNMTYLSKRIEIFAIECYEYHRIGMCGLAARSYAEKYRNYKTTKCTYTKKCGIFSLNDNKWISNIKPFEYEAPDLDGKVFSCKNCYDDDNVVYQLCNYNLSKYDITRNKWSLLSENHKLYRQKSKFWINGDVLYSFQSKFNRYSDNENSVVKLSSFDLRNNKKKWIVDSIEVEGHFIECLEYS